MKKIVFLFIIAGLFSCETQKKDSFTITGTLKKVPENALVILMTKDQKIMDSARVTNGNFTIKGTVQEPTEMILKVQETQNYKGIWIENSEISFSAEDGKFREAVVTGSNSQKEEDTIELKMQHYEDVMDQLDEYAAKNYQSLTKKDIDSLRVAYANAEKMQFAVMLEHIKAHPNSLVSLEYLDFYKTSVPNKEDVQSTYDALSSASKNRPKGKNIAEYLAKNEINLGDSYVDISLKNTQGQEMSLSQNLGTYTLIEFWGSRCAPCRLTNPKLVQIYNEFQPKGFEVFGVSFDTKKEEWLAAVKEDGLPWNNVVDLRGERGDVGLQYGISGLPDNVLLDKEGKVIARKISVKELKAKLTETLN
jgi:peroxiredoxin